MLCVHWNRLCPSFSPLWHLVSAHFHWDYQICPHLWVHCSFRVYFCVDVLTTLTLSLVCGMFATRHLVTWYLRCWSLSATSVLLTITTEHFGPTAHRACRSALVPAFSALRWPRKSTSSRSVSQLINISAKDIKILQQFPSSSDPQADAWSQWAQSLLTVQCGSWWLCSFESHRIVHQPNINRYPIFDRELILSWTKPAKLAS